MGMVKCVSRLTAGEKN